MATPQTNLLRNSTNSTSSSTFSSSTSSSSYKTDRVASKTLVSMIVHALGTISTKQVILIEPFQYPQEIEELLQELKQCDNSPEKELRSLIETWKVPSSRKNASGGLEPFLLKLKEWSGATLYSDKAVQLIWQIFTSILKQTSANVLPEQALKIEGIYSSAIAKVAQKEKIQEMVVLVLQVKVFSFLIAALKSEKREKAFIDDFVINNFFQDLCLFCSEKSDISTFYTNKIHACRFLIEILKSNLISPREIFYALPLLESIYAFPLDAKTNYANVGNQALKAVLEPFKGKKLKEKEESDLRKQAQNARDEAEKKITSIGDEAERLSKELNKEIKIKANQFISESLQLNEDFNEEKSEIDIQKLIKLLTLLKGISESKERENIAKYLHLTLSRSSQFPKESYEYLSEIEKVCNPFTLDPPQTKESLESVFIEIVKKAYEHFCNKIQKGLREDLVSADKQSATKILEKIYLMIKKLPFGDKIELLQTVAIICSQGIGDGKLLSNSDLLKNCSSFVLSSLGAKSQDREIVLKIHDMINKMVLEAIANNIIFYYTSPESADKVLESSADKLSSAEQQRFLLYSHLSMLPTPILLESILHWLSPKKSESVHNRRLTLVRKDTSKNISQDIYSPLKSESSKKNKEEVFRNSLTEEKQILYAECAVHLIELQVYGHIVKTEAEKKNYEGLVDELSSFLKGRVEEPGARHKEKWKSLLDSLQKRIQKGIWEKKREENYFEFMSGVGTKKSFVIAQTKKTIAKTLTAEEMRSFEIQFEKEVYGGDKISKTNVSDWCQKLFLQAAKVFQQLKMDEISGSDTQRSSSDVITTFINMFQGLSYFVVDKVLNGKTAEERAQHYKFFVAVAEQLRKSGEFNASNAIAAALKNNAIERLSETRKLLKDELKKLDSLWAKLSSDKNYSKYRKKVEEREKNKLCSIPLIAFLTKSAIYFNEPKNFLDSGLLNRSKLMNIGRNNEQLSSLLILAQAKVNSYEALIEKEITLSDWNYFITYGQRKISDLGIPTTETAALEKEIEKRWKQRSLECEPGK